MNFQLLLAGNDSLEIKYNLINSFPQNVEIYIDGTYIGNTPFYFMWGDTLFPKNILIRHKRYHDYHDTVYSNERINRYYTLKPRSDGIIYNPVKEYNPDYFSSPRNVLPIALTSVVTASSAVSAYYFKSLAISNRDAYDYHGDMEALSRKRKYDIISGVSLFVFQTSFAVLLYLLFGD